MINDVGHEDPETVPRQMLSDAYTALWTVIGQLQRAQSAAKEREEALERDHTAKVASDEHSFNAAKCETTSMKGFDTKSKPGKFGPHLAAFPRAEARKRVRAQWPDIKSNGSDNASIDVELYRNSKTSQKKRSLLTSLESSLQVSLPVSVLKRGPIKLSAQLCACARC